MMDRIFLFSFLLAAPLLLPACVEQCTEKGPVMLVPAELMHAESDAEKLRTARVMLQELKITVELYATGNRGRPPERLEELLEEDPRAGEPWLDSLWPDPWGNAFRYQRTGGRKFVITSAGPDGQFDTEDDIRWPETPGRD